MVAQLVWVPVAPPLLVALVAAQERALPGRARGRLAAESEVQDSAQALVPGREKEQEQRPVPVVAVAQVLGRLAAESVLDPEPAERRRLPCLHMPNHPHQDLV